MNLVERYGSGGQDSAGVCEFDGWTMVRGSAILAGKSAGGGAKIFDADACLAYAESTTWALGLEYGRPDGSVRSRSFVVEGDVGVAQVQDGRGRIIRADLAPKEIGRASC